MICVIVAHPDDESFWFGGALLMFREARLKTIIVCLTNLSNSVRAAEFQTACQKLGAQGLMLDFPDAGTKMLPDFGLHFEQLLQDTCLSLCDLDCVITHAPHGNERSHLQHIQCFRYVRQWCRAKKLPLGFFSEKPIPQLEVSGTAVRIHNRVTFQEVRFRSTSLLKELGDVFAATPLNIRGYVRLARAKFRMAQELGPVRSLFTMDISIANKKSLLATYPSQIEGLKQYETYHHTQEYLYLAGQQTARRLIPYLQCLSY